MSFMQIVTDFDLIAGGVALVIFIIKSLAR